MGQQSFRQCLGFGLGIRSARFGVWMTWRVRRRRTAMESGTWDAKNRKASMDTSTRKGKRRGRREPNTDQGGAASSFGPQSSLTAGHTALSICSGRTGRAAPQPLNGDHVCEHQERGRLQGCGAAAEPWGLRHPVMHRAPFPAHIWALTAPGAATSVGPGAVCHMQRGGRCPPLLGDDLGVRRAGKGCSGLQEGQERGAW